MSRNELRVIARIVLIGVGLYVLLQTLLTFISNIAIIPFAESPRAQMPIFLILLIAVAIYAVITLAVVYVLFRCEKFFTAKIVDFESSDDTQVSWLAAAFRLVCVISGVLFLYWSIPSLIFAVYNYIVNMNNEPGQKYIYMGMPSKISIAQYVILLGLSIYLAYGAPGFVRWQVRRTLKQCGKTEEQKPTWD
jgi:hypothetical protein